MRLAVVLLAALVAVAPDARAETLSITLPGCNVCTRAALQMIAGAPQPRYAHNDPSAVAPPVARGSDRRELMQLELRLEAEVEANPAHVGLRAALGHVQALRGDLGETRVTYVAALDAAGDDAELRRHVLWRRGWSMLNLGGPCDALRDWQEAAALHGGAPYWVPPAYAIGLWALDERDAAVRWYAAAARDFPEEWATRDAMARATATWTPKERSYAKAVFRAWEARR